MRDVLLRSSLPSARYRSPNSAPSSRTRIECQSVSRETLVCVSSIGSAPRGPLAACLVSRRPPRPSTPSLLHRTAPRHPSVPPPPRHGSDTRQSPRPAITSPPRCPSPHCLAARRSRSICRARSRRTRRARGARRHAAPRPVRAPRPCPRAPSAPCAPRFRAARTRPPRRPHAPATHVAGAARREPRRAVPIVTHRRRPCQSVEPVPDTRVASVMPYMSAPSRRIPQPHRSHPQGCMPVVHHLHLDPTRECFT